MGSGVVLPPEEELSSSLSQEAKAAATIKRAELHFFMGKKIFMEQK
jgi:hypothetical protein